MADFYVKAFDFKIVRVKRRAARLRPSSERRHDRPGDPALQDRPARQRHGLYRAAPFRGPGRGCRKGRQKARGLGGKHYMDQAEAERIGGFEVKFYGPEGILFDVAEHPWTGTEPLPVRAGARGSRRIIAPTAASVLGRSLRQFDGTPRHPTLSATRQRARRRHELAANRSGPRRCRYSGVFFAMNETENLFAVLRQSADPGTAEAIETLVRDASDRALAGSTCWISRRKPGSTRSV